MTEPPSGRRAAPDMDRSDRPELVPAIGTATASGRRVSTATCRPRRRPLRVAVTGGAGFIGSHVVEALVAGGSTVLIIDDLSHAADATAPDEADVLVADCGSDRSHAALARFAPEVVVHLAARGGVTAAARAPGPHTRSVLPASVALYAAAIDAGARRIVGASSGGALYGDARRRPTPEATVCRPRSVYGASKLAEEVYLAAMARTAGVAAMPLRFGNVYGPRQDGTGEAGVVAITARRLLDGLPPVLRGDGRQTRDFIAVGDVADAVVAAVHATARGPVNVGTGVETSVETIIERLVALAGSATPWTRDATGPGEVRHGCLDPTRAARVLGWAAGVGIADGLRDTWAWFAQHPAGDAGVAGWRRHVS